MPPEDDAVRTYARTLFDLAVSADAVDAVDEDLRAMAEAVREHGALKEALTDTSVPAETKRGVLRDIFGGDVAPETLAIVTLAVERGRADRLDELVRAFAKIAETERDMVVAEVTTAVPLEDELRGAVKQKVSDALGRPVVLRERVDGSIKGGIIIEVAGRVLDASVASQLDEARSALTSTPGGES
jgi:F-type H+-transporting ATPase subunit delta